MTNSHVGINSVSKSVYIYDELSPLIFSYSTLHECVGYTHSRPSPGQ